MLLEFSNFAGALFVCLFITFITIFLLQTFCTTSLSQHQCNISVWKEEKWLEDHLTQVMKLFLFLGVPALMVLSLAPTIQT